MKNVFYFTLKAFFVFKIFKFLSWLQGQVGKQLDMKDKVNFKNYDITTWETGTILYLKKKRQSDNEIWSVNIV